MDLRGLIVLGIIFGAIYFFVLADEGFEIPEFGNAGMEIYAVTETGKTIRMDSKTFTIIYNNQPISAIIFKPWIRASTSPSTSGSYSYTYTATVYINSQKVSSSTGSGTATLGSTKYLTPIQVTAATMERYIPVGRSATVKVEVKVTATWRDPVGREHTKTITLVGSAYVKHEQDYDFIITGGVTKSILSGIT